MASRESSLARWLARGSCRHGHAVTSVNDLQWHSATDRFLCRRCQQAIYDRQRLTPRVDYYRRVKTSLREQAQALLMKAEEYERLQAQAEVES